MDIIYSTRAKEDRDYWEKTSPKTLKRIYKLLEAIQINPFSGIGKPEPLKFQKSGYWSRRVDEEHHLVYKIANDCIYIAQCRYHYK